MCVIGWRNFTFDREKYITTHFLPECWTGEDESLASVLDDLDVYFGRDNGIMIHYLNMAGEDPYRPGYADPSHLKTLGKFYREKSYGQDFAARHKYDFRNDVMIGGQPRAFWTEKKNPTGHRKTGWQFADADAAGDFMGRFLNEFYRDEGESPRDGQARPKFLEIVNEPLYELIDGHKGSEVTPLEVFEFHNRVAREFV